MNHDNTFFRDYKYFYLQRTISTEHWRVTEERTKTVNCGKRNLQDDEDQQAWERDLLQ